MQFTPLSESKLSTPSLSYKNMQNRNRNRTETPRTYREKGKKVAGLTEIWTRIAGFRVQSANHYTMGPYSFSVKENYQVEPLIATDFFIADLDLRSGSTDLYKDFVQNIEWKLDKNE